MSADVLLQRIVEIAADVFGADLAMLFLTDEARPELRARAAVGVGAPLAGFSMSATEGVGSAALSTRSP